MNNEIDLHFSQISSPFCITLIRDQVLINVVAYDPVTFRCKKKVSVVEICTSPFL